MLYFCYEIICDILYIRFFVLISYVDNSMLVSNKEDSSNDRIAETHNLTNKHSEKLTMYPRQTESDKSVMERRMVAVGPNPGELEARLLEGQSPSHLKNIQFDNFHLGFTHLIAGMKQNMEQT